MHKWRSGLCALALMLILLGNLHAEKLKSIEFRNQAISDILMSIARVSGISIIPDETVTGTASWCFSDTEMESALSAFLVGCKLYQYREGTVRYISRISARPGTAAGRCDVDADEVDCNLLIRNLGRRLGCTIISDNLPKLDLSLHLKDVAIERVLQIILVRFPDYRLTIEQDCYVIRKVDAAVAATARQETAFISPCSGTEAEKRWNLDVERARGMDVFAELFKKVGREYLFMSRCEANIENVHLAGRSFEQLMRVLCDQTNLDWTEEDHILYLVELPRKEILKKFRRTITIPLQYISIQDLLNLLPADAASAVQMKTDKTTNCVIASGMPGETAPLEALIRELDKPAEQVVTGQALRKFYRFDLKVLKAKDALSLLPPGIAGGSPILLPDNMSFLLLTDDEGQRRLNEYLALVDKRPDASPIRLKYLKTDDLMKNLPPSVLKDDLVDTGLGNTVFFTGSEDKRRRFLKELETIDRPRAQIRYKVLVIQYQKGKGFNWSTGLSAQPVNTEAAVTEKTGTGNNELNVLNVIGEFKELLGLHFDVLSEFGYRFAADLNIKLNRNQARVYADTTLHGLSGQELKFQNTNTYRYVDQETDVETGKLKPTGVTREITSGLIIALNGWVSGDGMITMDVNSTVSKRGADAGGQAGSAPLSTSERVVTTHVRTPSGKPVVISGLIQRDTVQSESKVPILGDIPVIGALFTSLVQTEEESEMVIYLVPQVQEPGTSAGSRMSDSALMAEMYQELVEAGHEN